MFYGPFNPFEVNGENRRWKPTGTSMESNIYGGGCLRPARDVLESRSREEAGYV